MLYGCTAALNECNMACGVGYDYLELSGKAIAGLEGSEFSALERSLKLPVLGLNAYCPPEVVITGSGYDRENTRRYALCVAKRAEVLGVRCVGIGSPMSRNRAEGFPADLAARQIREFLSDTAEIFEKHGITVCLEALAICYCNTVNRLSEAAAIAEAINSSNLKLVVDFYNMEHMKEADDPLDFAYPLISHAHISDDDGSPRLRSYLKPEKRDVHRSRIDHLKALGYGNTLTLETDVPFDAERAAKSLEIMKL